MTAERHRQLGGGVCTGLTAWLTEVARGARNARCPDVHKEGKGKDTSAPVDVLKEYTKGKTTLEARIERCQ